MSPPENIVHLWLHHLEHWQSLVAGLLGFGGVITTLWVNAWLERDVERHSREREAAALLAAIAADFATQSVSAEGWTLAEVTNPFTLPTPILDSVHKRLWLLEQEQIVAITHGLAMRAMTRDSMRLRVEEWRVIASSIKAMQAQVAELEKIDVVPNEKMAELKAGVLNLQNHQTKAEATFANGATNAARAFARIADRLDPGAIDRVRTAMKSEDPTPPSEAPECAERPAQ